MARLYNTYSCPREVYQINVKAPIYYKLIIGAVAVSHGRPCIKYRLLTAQSAVIIYLNLNSRSVRDLMSSHELTFSLIGPYQYSLMHTIYSKRNV